MRSCCLCVLCAALCFVFLNIFFVCCAISLVFTCHVCWRLATWLVTIASHVVERGWRCLHFAVAMIRICSVFAHVSSSSSIASHVAPYVCFHFTHLHAFSDALVCCVFSIPVPSSPVRLFFFVFSIFATLSFPMVQCAGVSQTLVFWCSCRVPDRCGGDMEVGVVYACVDCVCM